MKLLTRPEGNPKTAKSLSMGIATAILHLSPYKSSGHNVCPNASKGCAKACLHTAGNPLYARRKYAARLARTRLFFEDRNMFMAKLNLEISNFVVWCNKHNLKPAIRLNGTSDILWERIGTNGGKCIRDNPLVGGTYRGSLMDVWPCVQFYDYTKISPLLRVGRPDNYHLTFSLSENNDALAYETLQNGGNVAVVFNITRGHVLPYRFRLGGKYWSVFDGDATDLRYLDPSPVIVGLRAKGKAKNDQSGFVRSA